jgi:hypothetical protein
MELNDAAWWPVVELVLMYPNQTTQESVNNFQALMD